MTGLSPHPAAQRPWPPPGHRPEPARGGQEGVLPQEVCVSLPLPDGSATHSGGSFTTDRPAPDRNLALELVRVTLAGAMASRSWEGSRDRKGVRHVAGTATRSTE